MSFQDFKDNTTRALVSKTIDGVLHYVNKDRQKNLLKLMKTLIQRFDTTRKVTVAMHPRYRNWETDSLPCLQHLQRGSYSHEGGFRRQGIYPYA